MYCHWRVELTGKPLGEKKMSQPRKRTFWEEVPKNLKIYFPPYHYFLWLCSQNGSQLSYKKDVKPSLETWNVNDVIVYVWYIYSQIKKNKRYEM